MLELKQAVKKARAHSKVKDLEGKGYFLNSAISLLGPGKSPEEWILTFYSPGNGMVEQVNVEESVEVKTPSKPINPTTAPLELSKVRTGSKKAMEKATKEFRKLNQKESQCILTISTDGSEPVWKANFVTLSLNVVIVRVSAFTGEVMGSEVQSLIES